MDLHGFICVTVCVGGLGIVCWDVGRLIEMRKKVTGREREERKNETGPRGKGRRRLYSIFSP